MGGKKIQEHENWKKPNLPDYINKKLIIIFIDLNLIKSNKRMITIIIMNIINEKK